MPKVSAAWWEGRRQQILRAAAACFARRGFHGTRVQDICREAGLSPGGLYRYFASKEEIIRAMAEEGERRDLAILEEARSLGGAREVAHTLLRAFLRRVEEGGLEVVCLDVELVAEATRNPQVAEVLRNSLRRLQEAAAGLVREAQRRGELDPALDAKAVAQVLVAIFQGLVMQRALGIEVDSGAYGQVVEAMLDGILKERKEA